MWVTCYCDASYHDGIATYAVWMRSERGKQEFQGDCPEWVKDNNVAELYAIFASLKHAVEAWGSHVTGVLICSDSDNALKLTWPWADDHRREDFSRIQRQIREFRVKHELSTRTKWIKGHEKAQGCTIQTWLNRWCNRKAYNRQRNRQKAEK